MPMRNEKTCHILIHHDDKSLIQKGLEKLGGKLKHKDVLKRYIRQGVSFVQYLML